MTHKEFTATILNREVEYHRSKLESALLKKEQSTSADSYQKWEYEAQMHEQQLSDALNAIDSLNQ